MGQIGMLFRTGSGTYGGDVNKYGRELSQKNQLLNGEYGAWRSIGLHTEPAAFDVNGVWSEERMCQLMETKIRLAEQGKGQCVRTIPMDIQQS